MERGVFLKQHAGRAEGMAGRADHHATPRASAAPGRTGTTRMFKCGGFNAKDFFCVKELDDQFAKYLASYRPRRAQAAGRARSSATILENYYFVPVFRHAFVNAIGPRIAAQKWQDVFPTITTGYAYPWEDIKLKDSSGSELSARGIGDGAVHHPAHAATRIVTLFILSLTIFTVVRLTGDPVTLLAEPGARAEDLDRVRTEWGLDRPWPVQYARPSSRTSSPASSASRSTTRCRSARSISSACPIRWSWRSPRR